MITLTEKEAEAFLEQDGFKIIKRAFVRNKEDIVAIVEKKKIDFPLVMKASGKKIIHKAKLGGVILNIKNLKSAEKAFFNLQKIQGFEEAMIQPMIKGNIELIIGIKKTPEFNHVIMFGKGGKKVESEKDVSFRVLPIQEQDAQEMIKEIKFYRTLVKKQINFGKIKKIMLKLSSLSGKYPSISELDINPLMITPKEAFIADARIVLEE